MRAICKPQCSAEAGRGKLDAEKQQGNHSNSWTVHVQYGLEQQSSMQSKIKVYLGLQGAHRVYPAPSFQH